MRGIYRQLDVYSEGYSDLLSESLGINLKFKPSWSLHYEKLPFPSPIVCHQLWRPLRAPLVPPIDQSSFDPIDQTAGIHPSRQC